jgi:hypothetical protein
MKSVSIRNISRRVIFAFTCVPKLILDSHRCYIITLIQITTEYLSWVIINPASFIGGPRFKSLSQDQLCYSNWCFPLCYTVPPGKCWGFTLKHATPFQSISFPIHCSCIHSTSEYYIIYVAETLSLSIQEQTGQSINSALQVCLHTALQSHTTQ